MPTTITPDICVIGAGSAGLSVAAGASQMGAETVLLEKGKMGGDCLNYGCVPSKSLLVAAKAANAHTRAAELGLSAPAPKVDFAAVSAHVHGVIAAIAPQDSVERFEALGVRVVQSSGAFTGPREVAVGDLRIRARRFVVATGSQPLVPPIPGLEAVPYLTNETVFDLTALPAHLIVIGGGPIGCELGQAFRLLGAQVTIVEMASILPKDDPELVDVVRRRLRADGIDMREGTRVVRVTKAAGGVEVTVDAGAGETALRGSTLLLAAGRRPVVEGLDLDAAGISHTRAGITVDARLRTSNTRVYAAGDVSGGYQFTHVAGYHAGIILRNALFRLPAKADMHAVPWVTYTDPELAHVGLGEAAARQAHGKIRILRWPFAENDRAQAERRTDGFIKVIATPRGKILGASLVGAHAGEGILPWVLALSKGLGLSAMAGVVAPYPTMGEISKRVAGSFFTDKLFSAGTRKLVRFLAHFG
ncbi:MAG TPA: FAD-dependent oxidoreductase [Kiloniellales bacterium]|jgi:pyruvate/2-oxoglutarate dehydrogenase complex dihydrolipoamide dehydrogenase (E3) component